MHRSPFATVFQSKMFSVLYTGWDLAVGLCMHWFQQERMQMMSQSEARPHQVLLEPKPGALITPGAVLPYTYCSTAPGLKRVLPFILQYPFQGVSAHQQGPEAYPHAIDVRPALMVDGYHPCVGLALLVALLRPKERVELLRGHVI